MTENSDTPLVSIVVPNWNGGTTLRTCLNSLTHLAYPSYEIIVIDNASTDRSPDMVRKEFPDARLIINQENLFWAGGCNVGIGAAKGDLIAFFNNDAIADPNWLPELIKVLKESPRTGIVGGIVCCTNPPNTIDDTGLKLDPVTGTVWRVNHGKLRTEVTGLEDIDFVSGVDPLVRRELIEKIGPFDKDYSVFEEETDFQLNAKRAGYQCKIVASAIIWHLRSSTVKRLPSGGYYLKSKSDFRFYFKNLPLRYLPTALSFQLFVEPLFEAAYSRHPKFFLMKSRAFLWSLSQLKEIFGERKKMEFLGKIELKSRLTEFVKIALRASVRARYA